MGYNGKYGYRDSSSRQANRLSGNGGATTITMEKGASGIFSKIADVATASNLPQVVAPGLNASANALKQYQRFVQPLLKLHPAYRILSYIADVANLIDLMRGIYPTGPGTGPWVKTCETSHMRPQAAFDYTNGPNTIVQGGPPTVCSSTAVQAWSPTNPAWRAVRITDTAYQIHWWRLASTGAQRALISQNWNRPAGGTQNPPQIVGFRHTPFLPSLWRYRKLDPLRFAPPHADVQDPIHIPYPMIPDPELAPPWPSEIGNTAPSGENYIPTDIATTYRGPPGRRTRELKYRASGTAEALERGLITLSNALGKLTDLRDLIGALHDALPNHLQLKGQDKKQIQKLLRQVANNLSSIDGEKALLNIIKEIAEDVVGGVSDSYAANAAKEFGWFKQKFHLSARF